MLMASVDLCVREQVVAQLQEQLTSRIASQDAASVALEKERRRADVLSQVQLDPANPHFSLAAFQHHVPIHPCSPSQHSLGPTQMPCPVCLRSFMSNRQS